MLFTSRTQYSHLNSLLPSHTPLWPICLPSTTPVKITLTECRNLYVPLLLLSLICPISLLANNLVPNMCHWRLPKHRPSLVNQGTTTVNSLPPKVQAHSAPSTTKVPLRKYPNSPSFDWFAIIIHYTTGKPDRTASNVMPGLATPVFQPTYLYDRPFLLSWSFP